MNWLPYKEDDLLKVMDINASPEVDENFKVLLLSLAAMKGNNPYMTKKSELKLEVIMSPYAIQEVLAGEEGAQNVFQTGKFYEKLDSLVGFCEANGINYIRFSLKV